MSERKASGSRDNDEVRIVSVLVIDDEAIALKVMLRIATTAGYHADGGKNFDEAAELLSTRHYDIVLTDLLLSGDKTGLDVMDLAKRTDPFVEVIIITGHGSIDSAIDATRKGAFHYLQKPVCPDEVRHVLHRAAEKHSLESRVRDLEQQLGSPSPTIIGKSQAIVEIKRMVTLVQNSESTVLITGESGTGKELVAQSIHYGSHRRDRPFVAINCGSLTDDLLSNELFGHEKEAFTGASKRVAGLLESANGGTVFLDEVGDMSSMMQAKILRVIQERELIRVGGSKTVDLDIRFLTATNKDLKKLVAARIFREDLFYRLNVIQIPLPRLSDRREDIPLLATWFLTRCHDLAGRSFRGFSPEALKVLLSYSYPGNVRELENIVERAASFATGITIEQSDLPADLTDYAASTFNSASDSIKSLEEIEMDYILWVLEKVDKNKSEAARLLGIDRVSLYRKLKRRSFDE